MMKPSMTAAMVLAGCIAAALAAEPAARITRIDGVASLMRKDGDKWRQAKPNTPLSVGDQLYTESESFIEIRYHTGAILRMDEKTKIILESSSEKSLATKSPLGKIWVNMKKLTTQGTEFQVSTPTATAAIRGTIYKLTTDQDSSSTVDVYDGKVAVGPSDRLKQEQKKEEAQQPGSEGVGEVPGPEEIPGPYEVSLETWLTIVAGQRIAIRNDGKFAQGDFDPDATEEAFVKKNKELDTEMMKK